MYLQVILHMLVIVLAHRVQYAQYVPSGGAHQPLLLRYAMLLPQQHSVFKVVNATSLCVATASTTCASSS
jgi:hypothetical protein